MLSLLRNINPGRRFPNRPFLFVDWMTTGAVLAEVKITDGRPTVVRSQFEHWPAELNLQTSPEEAGAWLKSVCEKAKYPANPVAISVPRRDLSLKLLELPNVSDDELGPLVALQVELRIQSTGQSVAWDFLAHPALPEDTHRFVMLATLPSSVLEAIQKAARAANWSNPVITSGDLLISNIAPADSASADNAAWQFHVQANRTKLELQLCYRSLPVSSYATAMPKNGLTSCDGFQAAATILQSMSARLIAGIPDALQTKAESQAATTFIAGSFAPQITAALAKEAVVVRQTLADEITPRAIAVATSLVSDNVNRIDFLRPRSADGRIASRRRRGIQILTVCAAVVSIAAMGLWMWQRSLQKELAQLEAERQQLEQFLDRGKEVVDKWSYVSRWQNNTVQATEEIRSLAALIPSRERMIVTRLQLENVVDSEAAMLRMDGMAQSADDVLQMNSSILEHSAHYDLRPQGIEPSPVGSSLPSQFRIEAVLRDAGPETRDADEKESK